MTSTDSTTTPPQLDATFAKIIGEIRRFAMDDTINFNTHLKIGLGFEALDLDRLQTQLEFEFDVKISPSLRTCECVADVVDATREAIAGRLRQAKKTRTKSTSGFTKSHKEH